MGDVDLEYHVSPLTIYLLGVFAIALFGVFESMEFIYFQF